MLNVKGIRGFVLAIAASAIALTMVAQPAKADPANGTCKANIEVAVAFSPAHAQAAWVASVSSKFGTKWAHWVGAKNKVIVPMNGGTHYQAVAKPCFYQPVT